MAVKIDHENKPVVDWFAVNGLEYVTVTIKNDAVPKGEIVAYGKFKSKDINPYYYDDITPEELAKFGEYLKSLTTKP